MSIFKKIQGYMEIGGIKLLLVKAKDKVLKEKKYNIYLENLLKDANPKDYPRLVRAMWMLGSNEPLDLNNPKTFNEKIQWLKLYDTTPLKTKLADKYLVREWVADKIGEKYLVPLLGVWDKFDDIDFSTLPNKFVLKCNHGSGMNIIVKDKDSFDVKAAKHIMDDWMSSEFCYINGFELQYRDVPHKIIAEKFIEQMDEDLLDYKIHVFAGEPRIIQVIGDRNMAKHTAKEAFLDLNWQPQELMYHTYESYEQIPKKPSNLDEMLEIASILGAEFKYVRVDLYDIEGEILFGEMTFTPASGYGKWGGERTSIFSRIMDQYRIIEK